MDVTVAGSEIEDIAYEFFAVVANVSEGDWTKQSPEWQDAATRVRDRWHLWMHDNRIVTVTGEA